MMQLRNKVKKYLEEVLQKEFNASDNKKQEIHQVI